MSNFKFFLVAVMVLASTFANALVRIVPQNTYGSPTESRFDPISDRIENVSSFLDRVPMGGAYDIVYSASEDNSKVRILACPSLRLCKDTQTNCIEQEKYWRCEQIFEASPAKTCKRYRQAKAIRSVLKFAGIELLEGILISPIAFFSHGIGLVIADGSAALDTIKEKKEIQGLNCDSMPVNLEGSDFEISKLTLKVETKKNQVIELFNIFSPLPEYRDQDLMIQLPLPSEN